ncbi:unnamed protein product [Paramecium primaurelia]|uniref:Uncharacterized protein n=1 Tax=Paramecium primaurelia TaxID=5886 RepID=A0A8S1KJQ2_PARPR|nr:unnamed protein product [Paramecium primaurelia]
MYILQIINATLECTRAPILNLILLLISLTISLFQIVLLTKYNNLNIYTQFAINIMSVFAKQNDQFMILQSLVGFTLFMQIDQIRWQFNILACSIHVTLICIYSQNNEVQSYLMTIFNIIILTYFSWAVKEQNRQKEQNQGSLLTSRMPNTIKSLISLEDIHFIEQKAIVLDNTSILEVRSFANDLRDILIKDDISEDNFLDHMKILKVDKQTQKDLNQKIKGISIRQLISKCQILQKTTQIIIIKTNFIQLEYYQIKLYFERDVIILKFEEIKEFAKYIKKNSCYALMNKLFQSFSHEFGTLLNQIALNAQNGFAQFPSMKEQFDSIYNCVVMMNNMVKDLKDFHQLRSKTFQLEIVDVNIDNIFYELQNLFKQQSTQKKISLVLVNKVYINFKQDEQRIKQILQNLIQNAIKYTNQDGNIYVISEKEDDKRIKFSVIDSGIGISESVAYNIEQMLGNDLILTSKLSEGAAGLGLGLLNSNYLIKHLSSFQQAHKEHLQFTSKLGNGTKFWFYIWKYQVLESPSSQLEQKSIKMIDKKVFLHQKSNIAPPLSSIIQNPKSCPSQIIRLTPNKSCQISQQPQIFFPQNIKDENIMIMEEDDRTIAEDPKPNHLPGQRVRLPSMSSPQYQYVKLLLVDDEPANLFPLKIMIKMLGFESDIAINGQQAIQQVESRLNQKCQYHLILMDINMPQMDGFQTTRLIKQIQPEIIIVACSAFSDILITWNDKLS